MKHMAGAKIRDWREAHRPKLPRATLAERLGVGESQVFRWEERGHVARAETCHQFQEWGVCELGDWFKPAESAAA